MQQAFSFLHSEEQVKPNYSYKLSDLCRHIANNKEVLLGFDIETEGLDPYNPNRYILSTAFVWREEDEYKGCCLLTEDVDHTLPIIQHIFNQKTVILVGQNIKFDLNWWRIKYGVEFRTGFLDTLLMSYLINENLERNGLDALLEIYLPGVFDANEYKQDKKIRSNIGMLSTNRRINYNCKDSEAVLRLARVLWDRLRTRERRALALLASNLQNTISRIEVSGVYLDFDFAGTREASLMQEAYATIYKIQELSGDFINPDSDIALVNTLQRMGATLTEKTDKDKWRTDNNTLRDLQADARHSNNLKLVEVIDNVITYRKNTKLANTYYKRMRQQADSNGRYHISYYLGKQASDDWSGGTVTGRLSSSMQNAPRNKDFRGMFAAPKNAVLLDGDYSQLELRVAAYMSQEPVLVQCFQEGKDVHTAVLADMKGLDYDEMVEMLEAEEKEGKSRTLKNERVVAKTVNFGTLYGATAHRLQKELKYKAGLLWELDKCEDFIKRWMRKYTRVAAWLDETKHYAVKYKCVPMPMGQVRHLHNPSFQTGEGRGELRQATNFPIQSFASWICLLGCYLVDEYFQTLPVPAKIVMQVHDSVTSEIGTTEKNYLTKVEKYVRMLFEVETINVLNTVWGIDFNVPLEFKTSICERWS